MELGALTEYQEKISQGPLVKLGLLDEAKIRSAAELLERLDLNDIETVRVVFADQHGVLRGKTIVASALLSVFCSGLTVPSTLLLKDTSHRTVFPVWSPNSDHSADLVGAGDILLVPDPDTFRPLAWTDKSSWLFCTPKFKTGTAIPFASREVLQTAIDRLASAGKSLVVGLEVEFHVFELLDPSLDHSEATMPGQPVKTRNTTQGYQLLTETRYPALEQIMGDLRRNCQALGLPVRSMEIEMGPSQFEFTFDAADPMTHADNMMMFRTMVKEVCSAKGLHATFMSRPHLENSAASGWHLHQSLIEAESGKNLLIPPKDDELSQDASSWIAGLLKHAAETSLLTTPTVNGYKRYRPHQLAPDRIAWGRDNRGTMIRAIMAPGDPASRIENRVAETAANPYYFFAGQILSGLEGLKSGLKAPDPIETPYSADVPNLPENLLAAIECFEASEFYRNALGEEFVDYLSHIRRSEWDRYNIVVSDWEQREYFNLY